MKKLLFLTILFLGGLFLFPKVAFGTAFYVDFSLPPNSGNGLATTTATSTLNSLVNNARAVGDVIFVRRGVSTTTVTDLTFLSDGNLNNPITITADYDNLWNEFATTTETFTLTFGNTFVPSSASSTTVFANKWIYVAGDCGETYNATTMNTCEYAYEVASSSPSGFDLYLPYKGNQSGAGLYLRVMPSAPQWNTTTGDFQWTMSQDDYWYFKGIDVRGTDSICVISESAGRGFYMQDMILQGNGVSDCGLSTMGINTYLSKIRFFGFVNQTSSAAFDGIYIKDFIMDCNNVASSYGFRLLTSAFGKVENGTIQNCITDFSISAAGSGYNFIFSNIKRKNVQISTGATSGIIYFEDDFGMVGLNSQSSNQISANTKATTTISDIANLRSGGGPTNELIYPPTGTANTGLSTKYFPFSFIKLFEYPIYADTSNKTYTMYFNSTSTAQFVADPTATEFWIECEYYNVASGADRMLKKSTGVVDFNGSTAWQSLAVTCQPTQAGILYLRGFYGKPSDGYNAFYLDTTPVISTP